MTPAIERHELPRFIQGTHGVRIAWAPATLDTRREVSRELLCALLKGRVEGEYALTQQCGECGSDSHGPVSVLAGRAASAVADAAPAPLVSISYAGSLAVVGIAPPGATALGIDAEVDTPQARSAAAEALGLSEVRGEGAEITAWTRIEAAAKARGSGLRGAWVRGAADPELTLCDLTLPGTALSGDSGPVVVSVAIRLPAAPAAGAATSR